MTEAIGSDAQATLDGDAAGPGVARPAGGAYLGEALDRLNRVNFEITNIFNDAGFEPIEPAILQPADPLFELYGEEIRERAFIVEPVGRPPLCLRPDFTVPVAQAFLETALSVGPDASARYGYFGPVFRNVAAAANGAADTAGPFQHLQAGIEIIGEPEPAARDAEVFDLATKALKWCGCASYEVETGDLSIIFSLIDALKMPETLRRRLKRHFWRPARFQQLVRGVVRDGAAGGPAKSPAGGRQALLKAVGALPRDEASAALADAIGLSETPHIGVRSSAEVIGRLLEQAIEARDQPLSREAATLVETVLAVKGPSAPSLARLKDLCRAAQVDLNASLDRMDARLEALSGVGVDIYTLPFDAAFGRNLEYYDSFVFEMRVENGSGVTKLGGGGRYDRLFRALRAPAPISGVGAALRPEAIVEASTGLGGEAAE